MIIVFILIVAILIIFGTACFYCGIVEGEPIAFLIGVLSFLGLVWVLQGAPLSSKYSYLSDPSKYFQITPYENGFLVTNLKNLSTSREFDVRFIQAYKDGRLYVKQTENFNIFGKSTETSYSLSFNP